jgi:hypothetical protein
VHPSDRAVHRVVWIMNSAHARTGCSVSKAQKHAALSDGPEWAASPYVLRSPDSNCKHVQPSAAHYDVGEPGDGPAEQEMTATKSLPCNHSTATQDRNLFVLSQAQGELSSSGHGRHFESGGTYHQYETHGNMQSQPNSSRAEENVSCM